MNAFEKGYQAWKASKAAPAEQSIKNNFELSSFDKKYLQWQYNTGRITEEQAVAKLNKPYTDFIGQVNGILSGYDKFANNYNNRFGGRKYDMSDAYMGDSQQYLDEATAYNQQLIAQSNAILATLEANPDAFDKETVEAIKSSLTMAQENAAAILKVAGEDNAYWNSWGSNDQQTLLDMLTDPNKTGSKLNPFYNDAPKTGEEAYKRAQQDQSYALKYEGKTGTELVNLINFIDDKDEREWVTGEAMRTMSFDEAQKDLDIMKQEYLELSQTGTLRNHAAAGMTMSEEEKAAAEAAVAQYEAVMKKYGIDTSDEDINPMEELDKLINSRAQLIAESRRMQEHIRLSSVKKNDDFEHYSKLGEEEASEYAEKNKKTDHMTASEIGVLAYYIAKDKENGTNLAEQYKDSLKFYLKHRRAEEIADWINDIDIPVIEGLTRISYAATAKTMNWGQDVLQNFFSNRKLNPTVFQMADDYIGQDLKGVDRILHQTAGVVGYMAPSIMASKFIGGATGVSSLGKTAGSVALYLGSAGSAYGDAIEKGYDKPVARAYSTLVGLSEVALQNVLGGISEFGGMPAKLDGKIAAIKNVLLKSAAKYGVSIAGEEIEENLQNFLEPAIRAMVLGEEYDMPTKQEIFDTIITTALSTSGMEGPGIVKESIKDAKVDKLIGENITEHSFLTPRERVVVNTITDKLVAEAEQGGKKLSADEKQKIYDQVVDDMDTGRIDIQQIEEAFGKGTEYEQLVSEYEELKELNKMNPMEMTGDQLDRRDELRKKNLEIGDKYGYGYRGYEKYIESYDKAFPKAVEGLVNSDRLSESYRERDRRSEKYKVEDLNRYSEAQRQTIQAAMDSGILNNTRRTHEFVDFIAKVSEKLGVNFSFTDNQRLKESGFALNGVTVNGYVNKEGITINVNSAKALNRVVGHEITHILKGTKLFDKLQKILFEYAKTKGEYDSRLQQITDLYKDKKGYTDNPAKIKEELMADLVGDYLFTDKQFVEKLFTEERGLFNWIRKQINYLHNLATAGSKEARQLERAMKVFDDVFKNKAQENEYTADDAVQENAKTETEYSLSNDSKFMAKAISKAQKNGNVSDIVLQEAKSVRSHVAERLNKIKDKGEVGLPEDVQGNTFFGNSSYGGSEENTTICPRSLAAEALVDAVSETLGRPLTVEEQIYISQDIQGRSLTPECTYCYVATDRKAYREFLGEYVKQRDSVIKAYKNGNHDTSRNGSLYQDFLNGRKDTDNMWNRFSMWIDTYKSGKPMMEASHLSNMAKLMGDIQSEFGKDLKPQITDAMAYAQSASWAKKRVSYVAYNGHILNWKQSKIDSLNSHYGLRMYSFSDFSPAFILENMQMITDAAVKGLKVLGYTKELDFAKIFAPTGMNINISTFGFEKDGGVYENNIIGANWTEAQKLRAENPNVGITFVATNDKLVEWALDQDWIDVVIPYHLVRTGKALAQKLGFTDYTKESADVKDEGWTDANEKSISPTMHNNDKATYLAALKENHLRPRFERFINHPNYMKLVNECRQSASESQPVQPKFNQVAADESLAKLEANGYYQPIGGTVDRMYEIASEIADKIEGGNLFSLSYDKQAETTGGGWDVRGQDVGLPMPEGYQEGGTVAADGPVGLPEPGFVGSYTGTTYTPKQASLLASVSLEGIQNATDLAGKRDVSFDDIGISDQLIKQAWVDAGLAYEETNHDGDVYYTVNDAMLMDERERRQKRQKGSTSAQAAQEAGIPGLEKSQPQSQGKAQSGVLPMPKQTPKDQQTAAREALHEALFGKQQTGTRPAQQTTQQEVEDLDAEFKRQMGDDSSYYDPAEGEEIETARERLEVQRSNLQIELRKNQRLRQEMIEDFDQKIEAKQAQYDGKKLKHSKTAQALLRDIEKLKRKKADRLAEFDKAIAQIERRIEIKDEKLATNKPEKQDRLEKAYERIDRERDAAELDLIKEYNEKKATISKGLDNKEQWIKNQAFDVLWEMGEWVKGETPSRTLGRIWDIRVNGQRLEWNDIKHALADIKDGTRVQKSYAEDAIMEVLERTYQDRVTELSALEESFNRDVEKLNKDAEKAKEEARKNESNLLRSELHEQLVGTVRQAFTDNKLDMDRVLADAKDLATIRTVDNTPQRVLEKALGRKAGQVLSDLTFNKVAQNETDGIRWLNSYTNRKDGVLKQLSEKYNIKPGSKESAAAQMYAEGFYVNEANEIVEYGDRELAADFPDVKTQANIKGLAKDPEIRRIYDETLDLINASRVRNAYPAIQKLDNYYLHFRAMGDTFSQLGLPFNPNDIRAKDLPTDLNGVTADLKPGQPYFASAQHREGKRTSFDLLGGLEMYLTSAKNQIFHIDDIQMLRALRNYVANVYGRANGLNNLDELTDEEQEAKIKDVYRSHLSTFAKFLNESANVLAGKTSLIDRGLEGFFGRKAMTVLNDINKQVGANMVGYNLGSPLTNFLAVMETLAKAEGFKGDFIKAAGQMAMNTFRRQSDGFAEKSSVIVRRKGAEQFNRTLWQKIGDPGYWLMSKTDEISTELIARTKYNELIRKGMDEKTAHYETDKWVSRLMGDRSMGQMPLIFNSKTLGIFTKFQLEVRNKLDSAFYDTIQEAKEIPQDVKNRNAKVAAKITSKIAQSAILDHVFGMAFQKIAGYNPAFDIISIIATAFGWNDDEDDDDTFLDNLEQAFFELLEDLPYTSTLTGGRIAIGNALPIKQLITGKDQYGNEKKRWKTLLGALPYYVLPGGYGQAKKTVQGLNMYGAFDWLTGQDHSVSGSYTDDGRLRYTVSDNPASVLQKVIFGKWAGQNAQQYIEEGRSPLSQKQTQEFFDLGVSIEEYWEIQDGLKELNRESDSGKASINEVGDYIGELDLTTKQKNILINNAAGRKEPIDMATYDEYPNFEEFDYGTKNPGKYAISQAVGGFEAFKEYQEDLKDLDKNEAADYINDLNIDYGMKIILYVSRYSSKASREEYGYDIVEYLNGRRDIDENQMRKILRELGFKVDWQGNVTWD